MDVIAIIFLFIVVFVIQPLELMKYAILKVISKTIKNKRDTC